jgi:hypothetical protein
LKENPAIFTFDKLTNGVAEVRDFQTTGVVAFEGEPFSRLRPGRHTIQGEEVQVDQRNIKNCIDAISGVVDKI